METPQTFSVPDDWPRDADGIAISELWVGVPQRWARLPLGTRKSLEYVPKGPPKPSQPGATRFTTDYAVAWGRKQGWKLIERESFDYRTNRHHDLEGGVDAMFDDGEGRVGVQGAGRYERAEHYRRFMDWGGPDKAKRRGLTVIYLEFERGNKTPIVEEKWA